MGVVGLAHPLVAVLRVAGGQRVVAEALDLVVLAEQVGTGLPVQRPRVAGFEPDLLRPLLVLGDAVSRFGRKRDHPRAAAGQEGRAEAAVDVTAAVGAHRLVAGDRVQGQLTAQRPAQAQVGAVVLQLGFVLAVERDLGGVEAGHKVVAAGLDDVGAKQARRAAVVAHVHVAQCAEVFARLDQQLHPQRVVAVALHFPRRPGGIGVVDPVAAGLAQCRHPQRHVGRQRHVHRSLGVDGVVAAPGDAAVALHLLDRRAGGFELDHAGRRVAAEQRALRAAQHLDAVEVESREALQDRVLLHHVVVDQRHRLRRVEAEVGVAVTADVEPREGPAERRFDVQTGHAAGQHAQVLAAGVQRLEQVAAQHADRARHVLHVLDAPLGGHRHRLQLAGLGRALGQGSGCEPCRGERKRHRGDQGMDAKNG